MFYYIPLTLQPEYRGVTAELVIRCQEVRIVYQNLNIAPLHAGHREFVFHIYACVSEAVTFPEPELFFTVTDQYDYYIDLFCRDLLVIDHVPVHQPPFHLHNYVCVRTGVAVVELGTVKCVNDEHGLQRLVLSDVNQTEMAMTNANRAMILGQTIPTRVMFIQDTAAYYRVDQNVVQRYVDEMILSGEIVVR